MNITYDNIVDANKGITYTDVRGKNYAEVAQRVQAFRKLIPGGYITTDIWKFENGVVYMKAEAGYYNEEGRRVTLATGYAFERQDASNINKTSFIENCETSAVGRCLGFIGLGSEKSIASAEEVDNAIKTQEAIASGKLPDPAKSAENKTNEKQAKATQTKETELPKQDAPAEVTVAQKLPDAPPANPVLEYMSKERDTLRAARGISKEQNAALWAKQVEVLRNAGLIPKKALSSFTMQEAQHMIQFMYAKFKPEGTELIPDDDGETA